MDLSGSVAGVTGAARGLGKAYAEALLQRKAKVAVIDILEEAGQATVEEFEQKYGKGCAIFLYGDVSKQDVMEGVFAAILSKLGPIDIMINNAGVGGLELSAELTIGINLLGLIRSTTMAIEHMRKDKGGNGGTIINIGSVAGLYTHPSSGIYCASKFGVVSYTRCVADAMPEEYNIKLVCLNPTFIVTDMTATFKKKADDGATKIKEWVEGYGGWVPMQTVTDCVMACLKDEVKNGSVVLVAGDGISYVETEIKKTPFPVTPL